MTHLKHITAICLAVALSVPGCVMVDSLNGIDTNDNQQTVVGSGRIVSVSFDFTGFKKVSLNNAFKAKINRSNFYSVTVEIDDNVKQYLNVYQYGDEIFIGLENNTYRNTTAEVTIGTPDIERIETSGAVSVRMDGFVFAHGIEFVSSGSSSIGGNLTVGDVTFGLSGSTTVELTGSANSLLVNGSGATVLHLFDFPVKDCRANLSGGSTSNMSVSDNLEVNLSGGSIFRYKGNPVVRVISISGGSIIQKVG
jgi:hypothetical protein